MVTLPAGRLGGVDRVVLLLQLGVDRGELVGERHHHAALLDRRVVLHLPVEHHRAGAVAHGFDHAPRMRDVLGGRAEHLVGDGDLLGVQRPGCRRSRAGTRCGTGPRTRPCRRCRRTGRSRGRCRASRRRRPSARSCSATGPAGTSSAGPRCRRRVGVLAHQVAGVAATHAGGLHPAVGGEVRGPEREPLHPRAGAADLLDVGDAARRLEDRVHHERLLQAGLGLELGEQAVDVVDVLGALHLRHHDHVELVADGSDERGQVVEHPGRVQGVDPGPELGGPEVGRPARSSPAPRGPSTLFSALTASSRLPSRTSI